ncbi:MAG: hypothetical protein ACK5MN_02455 [Lachnospiraceae bacterium]
MIITTDDVLLFKKHMMDQLNVWVHFQDACGGQSFSLDETSEEIRAVIRRYFENKNLYVSFSEDGLYFRIEQTIYPEL